MKTASKWSVVLVLMVVGATIPWVHEAFGVDRGWYINGGAGLNHLDVPWGEADVGPHLVVNGGYQFNRKFALELDSGYINTTFSSDSRRAGGVKQIPLVVNGVYSFSSLSRFEPFAGVGTGAMIVGYHDDWGADICLTFKGGMRYGINDHMSIGADYTYYLLGAMTIFISAVEEDLDPVGDDTVNLTLHWMF